jgi:hypothetical protein
MKRQRIEQQRCSGSITADHEYRLTDEGPAGFGADMVAHDKFPLVRLIWSSVYAGISMAVDRIAGASIIDSESRRFSMWYLPDRQQR